MFGAYNKYCYIRLNNEWRCAGISVVQTNCDNKSVLGVLVTACPVACIAVLVLLQGGFFPLATCVCGLLASVLAAVAWLRRPLREARLPIVPILFAATTLAYFISAKVNGTSLTTLAETGAWATCAGVAFLAAAQSEGQRALNLGAGVVWRRHLRRGIPRLCGNTPHRGRRDQWAPRVHLPVRERDGHLVWRMHAPLPAGDG